MLIQVSKNIARSYANLLKGEKCFFESSMNRIFSKKTNKQEHKVNLKKKRTCRDRNKKQRAVNHFPLSRYRLHSYFPNSSSKEVIKQFKENGISSSKREKTVHLNY